MSRSQSTSKRTLQKDEEEHDSGLPTAKLVRTMASLREPTIKPDRACQLLGQIRTEFADGDIIFSKFFLARRAAKMGIPVDTDAFLLSRIVVNNDYLQRQRAIYTLEVLFGAVGSPSMLWRTVGSWQKPITLEPSALLRVRQRHRVQVSEDEVGVLDELAETLTVRADREDEVDIVVLANLRETYQWAAEIISDRFLAERAAALGFRVPERAFGRTDGQAGPIKLPLTATARTLVRRLALRTVRFVLETIGPQSSLWRCCEHGVVLEGGLSSLPRSSDMLAFLTSETGRALSEDAHDAISAFAQGCDFCETREEKRKVVAQKKAELKLQREKEAEEAVARQLKPSLGAPLRQRSNTADASDEDASSAQPLSDTDNADNADNEGESDPAAQARMQRVQRMLETDVKPAIGASSTRAAASAGSASVGGGSDDGDGESDSDDSSSDVPEQQLDTLPAGRRVLADSGFAVCMHEAVSAAGEAATVDSISGKKGRDGGGGGGGADADATDAATDDNCLYGYTPLQLQRLLQFVYGWVMQHKSGKIDWEEVASRLSMPRAGARTGPPFLSGEDAHRVWRALAYFEPPHSSTPSTGELDASDTHADSLPMINRSDVVSAPPESESAGAAATGTLLEADGGGADSNAVAASALLSEGIQLVQPSPLEAGTRESELAAAWGTCAVADANGSARSHKGGVSAQAQARGVSVSTKPVRPRLPETLNAVTLDEASDVEEPALSAAVTHRRGRAGSRRPSVWPAADTPRLVGRAWPPPPGVCWPSFADCTGVLQLEGVKPPETAPKPSAAPQTRVSSVDTYLIKAAPWSEAEDARLLQAVAQHGLDGVVNIVKAMQRSRGSVVSRIRTLQKTGRLFDPNEVHQLPTYVYTGAAGAAGEPRIPTPKLAGSLNDLPESLRADAESRDVWAAASQIRRAKPPIEMTVHGWKLKVKPRDGLDRGDIYIHPPEVENFRFGQVRSMVHLREALQQVLEARRTGVAYRPPAVGELIEVEVASDGTEVEWRRAIVRRTKKDGSFLACVYDPHGNPDENFLEWYKRVEEEKEWRRITNGAGSTQKRGKKLKRRSPDFKTE